MPESNQTPSTLRSAESQFSFCSTGQTKIALRQKQIQIWMSVNVKFARNPNAGRHVVARGEVKSY